MFASETEEGKAWAESRIKQMTRGDPITARFMKRDFFTYHPAFKLVIIGNHRPTLKNVDDAAKRRFNIVPFIHKPAQPDRELQDKLKAESPAILRWMIEGCLDWQKNGLVKPNVVTSATDEYFSEQDILRQWVEDCCDVGKGLEDTNASLYGSWSNYAKAQGEEPGTKTRFTTALRREEYTPVKDTPNFRGRGFSGLKVRVVQHHYGDE